MLVFGFTPIACNEMSLNTGLDRVLPKLTVISHRVRPVRRKLQICSEIQLISLSEIHFLLTHCIISEKKTTSTKQDPIHGTDCMYRSVKAYIFILF